MIKPETIQRLKNLAREAKTDAKNRGYSNPIGPVQKAIDELMVDVFHILKAERERPTGGTQ